MEESRGAIHMVSAWENQLGMSLGQVKIEEKSNEITAIPVLLDMLEIKGCIITIDVMVCQTDIAEKIIEKQADYVLAVNMSSLNVEPLNHVALKKYQKPC